MVAKRGMWRPHGRPVRRTAGSGSFQKRHPRWKAVESERAAWVRRRRKRDKAAEPVTLAAFAGLKRSLEGAFQQRGVQAPGWDLGDQEMEQGEGSPNEQKNGSAYLAWAGCDPHQSSVVRRR